MSIPHKMVVSMIGFGDDKKAFVGDKLTIAGIGLAAGGILLAAIGNGYRRWHSTWFRDCPSKHIKEIDDLFIRFDKEWKDPT